MSAHKARIEWQRQTESFRYQDYDRNHAWHFENGICIQASAAPAYLGSADRVDPEEAFVASISSCHMLTFLAICSRRRLVVNRYSDQATGFLEALPSGKLAVTRVELSPQIEFEGTAPDAKGLKELHEMSHKECFIANSITTQVKVV